jgi:hypothetical protein
MLFMKNRVSFFNYISHRNPLARASKMRHSSIQLSEVVDSSDLRGALHGLYLIKSFEIENKHKASIGEGNHYIAY